jgi:hypothetical protein
MEYNGEQAIRDTYIKCMYSVRVMMRSLARPVGLSAGESGGSF